MHRPHAFLALHSNRAFMGDSVPLYGFSSVNIFGTQSHMAASARTGVNIHRETAMRTRIPLRNIAKKTKVHLLLCQRFGAFFLQRTAEFS